MKLVRLLLALVLGIAPTAVVLFLVFRFVPERWLPLVLISVAAATIALPVRFVKKKTGRPFFSEVMSEFRQPVPIRTPIFSAITLVVLGITVMNLFLLAKEGIPTDSLDSILFTVILLGLLITLDFVFVRALIRRWRARSVPSVRS